MGRFSTLKNLTTLGYFQPLLFVSSSLVSVASLGHIAFAFPYSTYLTVSPFSPLSASGQTMAEYSSLLSDLSENITNEDLEQLKSACKEDIPEDQSNNITSSKEWFSYLEKNDKLAQGETRISSNSLYLIISCYGLPLISTVIRPRPPSEASLHHV